MATKREKLKAIKNFPDELGSGSIEAGCLLGYLLKIHPMEGDHENFDPIEQYWDLPQGSWYINDGHIADEPHLIETKEQRAKRMLAWLKEQWKV